MRRSLPVASVPWYADGLAFSCTQCGNCCTGPSGYVWISDEEIDRLSEHLGLSRDETLKRYCRKLQGRISLKEKREGKDYPCIFLTTVDQPMPDGTTRSKRTCAIYPVRPLQCRTWPFWEGNLASDDDWERASRKCPGIDKGKKYTLQQIHALRDATDWPDREKTPGSM